MQPAFRGVSVSGNYHPDRHPWGGKSSFGRTECLLAQVDIVEVLRFHVSTRDVAHFTGSFTFFDHALEIRHALNMCSCDIPFLFKDLIDLVAELVKHFRMSYEKTTMQVCELAATTLIWRSHLQSVGHQRSCAISTRKKHIDKLVPDKTWVLVVTVKICYEREAVRG